MVEKNVVEGSPIRKAPSDIRIYKLIKLPNGLPVLLIHDPSITLDEGGEEDVDEEEDEGGVEDEDATVTESMETDESPCSSPFSPTDEGPGFASNQRRPLRHHADEEGSSHGTYNKKTTEITSTKKAAAAMCVGVGSFSDPVDAQGLAHFLEHMLFMGSEKFPDENEYDKYLSTHGGCSNAYTETEFTCFHFDVRNQYLKDALERFSQFFISPLAKAEAMDREVQAIESEFVQAMSNNANRLCQLRCHTAPPLHPFHGFSWGNKKSLGEPMEKGVDMRGKLLQLYKDHYRAGCMRLVVLGGEPMETLQKWVVELFSGVQEGGHGRMSFSWDGPIWKPNLMYHVESGRDNHKVSMMWPLPCLESVYLKKPHGYLSHLIGHEGGGSLLSLLKAKGWCTALSAGVGQSGYSANTLAFLFNVTIFLSNAGFEHAMEAVGLTYQYVNMILSVGPQEWVFKELQAISVLEFRYAEEGAADEYAMSLATNMHLYSEKDIIYGDYAFDEWDPDLVTGVLSRLSPANMRLELVTKAFSREEPGLQIEPWFQVLYKVETVPDHLMKLWADSPSVDPALHLPATNEFIPSNFTIRKRNGTLPENPRCLLDSAALKVWHKLDDRFSTPRANTCFSIICGEASQQLRGAVLMTIYVEYLRHELNEIVYLANIAKLQTSLTLSGRKIELKMYGFNEKLPVLAWKIAEQIESLVLRDEVFQICKEALEQTYNCVNTNPLMHAGYLRLQTIKERFWHVDLRLACLKTLTFKDFTEYHAELYRQTYIECILHGNLLEEEALGIANVFKKALVKKPLPLETRPKDRVVKLPGGTSLLYKEKCLNPTEKNSVVEMYFQLEQDVGKKSTRFCCCIDLFEHIIEEPCFNQLRTKEQLGYIVDSGAQETHRVRGFAFRVQSALFSPAYMEARMNSFIASLPKLLANLTDEEFKNYKDALIGEKLEMDCSLYDETERHWDQIWDQRYFFDECKIQAAELDKISKKEIVNWCRRYLGIKSKLRRCLCIHIIGRNAQDGIVSDKVGEHSNDVVVESPRRSMEIGDLEAFKKGRECYPALF